MTAGAEPCFAHHIVIHPTASHVGAHPIQLYAHMAGQSQGVGPQLRIHHPQWRVYHAAAKHRAVRIQAAFGQTFIQGNLVAVLL